MSQRVWDGGAGDGSWASGENWYPDGVPNVGEDILLDNRLVTGDYEVKLPAGNTSVSVNSLTIRPVDGRSIRLVIPVGNTAAPALLVTGQGESLRLDAGAILQNASGAASGDPVQLSGLLRISDGARYIHATPRANSRLIDRLSAAAGTSKGIFEFDVPGTSGYTVSLTGNTFGSLWFRASSAGGLKSYSGSGASDLYIRGDLVVDTGAGLTSTMTACIRLDGDLIVRGMLSLQPASAGITGRCLRLVAAGTTVLEAGNLLLQQHFREVIVSSGRTTILKESLQMPYTGQWLRIQENGIFSAGACPVTGAGGMELASGSTIRLGHAKGIVSDGTDGNIRTLARLLHRDARYIFDGTGDQQTGDGLPDSIASLIIDKPAGALMLTRTLQITGELNLSRGRLITSDSTLLRFSGERISQQTNEFGVDSCGWALSFIDGPMVRSTSRSGRLTMPIGRNGVFAPCILHRTDTIPAAYRLSYNTSNIPNQHSLKDPRLFRIMEAGYWELSMEGQPGHTAVYPELPWRLDGDSITRSRMLDSMHMASKTDNGSSAWEILDDQPVIQGNGYTGTIRSDKSISGSVLLAMGTSGTAIGLPITGIKLKARRIGTTTRLEWTTTGYSEQTRFLVERTNDHGISETVGTLTVSNTRNGDRFTLTDGHPAAGWNLYKVCADEGVDMGIYCSDQVPVYHPTTPILRLYPNPAEDWLAWSVSGQPIQGTIMVWKADGTQIWKGSTQRGRTGTIPLIGWKPGMYLISFYNGTTTYRQRFLKK